MAKKKNCLIFLYRGGVSVYVPDYPDIISFIFPETLVKDIDVINREELLNQITLLFQSNNINNANFHILIWDDVLFQKSFDNLPVDKNLEGIKEFINSVPFEYVITKEISSKGVTTVYVANKELVEIVMAGCEKSGNTVGFVSIARLVETDTDWTNGFSIKVGESLVHKISQIKQSSMMGEEKVAYELTSPPVNLPFYKKKENRRSLILAGVFFLLVVVLIVVYFMTANSNSNPNSLSETNQTNLAPVPPATTSPPPTNSIVDPSELKIQVRTNSTEKFSQIKTSLGALGIEEINLDSTNITPGARTILMLDTSLSPSLQDSISKNIESLYPSLTIQIIPILPNHAILIPGE